MTHLTESFWFNWLITENYVQMIDPIILNGSEWRTGALLDQTAYSLGFFSRLSCFWNEPLNETLNLGVGDWHTESLRSSKHTASYKYNYKVVKKSTGCRRVHGVLEPHALYKSMWCSRTVHSVEEYVMFQNSTYCRRVHGVQCSRTARALEEYVVF